METFKWCVLPKLTIENEPRRNVVQFGDGYAQRAKVGINSLLRRYPVTVKVKNKDRLAVDAFLAQHGGVEPFYFNDPFTKSRKKVVCGQWRIEMNQTYSEFSCEFEEVP
ncbi:tail protein [Gallibacterium anatis CCM5995]|uniref:phage tail protein n=1 Tax=Gallibacterium anatis TaxID=750 RepID=UPI00053138C1|nr:phage tail protein [Gallibacterium anatis]KGQ25499.1 tail protein [Gallibacterium anatis CCM5995]